VKILILRFSSIGDIVLTSPVIRVVKSAFPGAEIHFLTRKRFVSLVEFNPGIDRIHVLEPGLKNCIARLRKEQFDLILDLHRNIRSYLLGLGLNCPVYAFPKMNLAKLRMVFFKDRRLTVTHVAGRYLRPAIRALGVKPDNLGLEFFPCECERPEWPPGLASGVPVVVFALGGTHATKRMPPEKWVGFFPLIRDCSLVLVGGEEEIPAAQLIEQEAVRSGIRVVRHGLSGDPGWFSVTTPV
jgi:ADP-heptose:LPS heptosyltransferase